jgi:hypothetical protein
LMMTVQLSNLAEGGLRPSPQDRHIAQAEELGSSLSWKEREGNEKSS